jgi:para-aminobenzoate synthetase component 1
LRITKRFQVSDPAHLKKQLLVWAQSYDEVVWLDSNSHQQGYGSFDALLAVGALTSIRTDAHKGFDKLAEYRKTTNDWIFGYLSYDLKNDIEHLTSQNHDGPEFPELYFFQPLKIFILKVSGLEIHYLNMVADELDQDLSEIKNIDLNARNTAKTDRVKIRLRIHKDAYMEKVNHMLQHIQRGDIYEANFCQEFYAEGVTLHPLESYWHLNEISKPPFATFLKLGDYFLLSASPERYLKKDMDTIISQPIKGTARRSSDPAEDDYLKEELAKDPKERSENIMITDLVRNDLSKTALRGSVRVEELCKVYSFQQVHQMISTIVSKVAPSVDPVTILETTFPMGSMTGAPKIAAMKIIEDLEESKRGLYSGAVGYFTPDGDFDFNVVIRSIIYNAKKNYISFSVGSAITAASVPEKEYEECLVKAKAMREVLE